MRIPPGLVPKLVTSTRDAAAAGGDRTIPPVTSSRAPAMAAAIALVLLMATSIDDNQYPTVGTPVTTVNQMPNMRFPGAYPVRVTTAIDQIPLGTPLEARPQTLLLTLLGSTALDRDVAIFSGSYVTVMGNLGV